MRGCIFYYGRYHLYAVDGTDVNIAKNSDSDSYIENGQNEGYNQLHVICLIVLQINEC